MSTQNITLKIKGLCPIIFDGDRQRAMVGILRESKHVPSIQVNGTEYGQFLEGIASLNIVRAMGSSFSNQINRLSQPLPSVIPNDGVGEFGFNQCMVNIQNHLYGGDRLKIRTWMLKFRLVVNDGEFFVSKLFKEMGKTTPEKVAFVCEGDDPGVAANIVYQTYLPDEITVRMQLDTDDFALLTFDTGDELTLDASQSHEILLSNECPCGESGSEDDFSYHYVMYDLAGRKRVRPVLMSGGDGTSLCNPGYNCNPPSSCS